MSAFSGFGFFFYRNIYLFICLCHVSAVACRIFFDFGTWDLLLLLLSRFSCVRPHRRQPTKLPHPWESPGKNTGVGSHFLLQCMKVKSESEVAQSVRLFATPWTAAYQAPPSMGFSRQEYWSGVPLPRRTQIQPCGGLGNTTLPACFCPQETTLS